MKKMAVILAGGKSRRFGSDKVLARWKGKTFIEHVAEKLQEAEFEIFVSLSSPKEIPIQSSLLIDPIPGEGPLQAVLGAFQSLSAERILFVTADMPFVTPQLLKDLWDQSDDYDLICFKEKDRFHFFPGVYSKRVVKEARMLLEEGRRDMKSLLHRDLQVQMFSHEGFNELKNVNTPEDLRMNNE